MKDKSKLTAIILAILAILVVIISFITNNKDKSEVGNINIVTNYSNFYTVESCLYRSITYLSSKDNSSVYRILSDNYKKQNKISEETVIDIFPSIPLNSIFSSNKMYYQEINENITKYYVYGRVDRNYLLESESINDSQSQDTYFIVYLDRENKTFSIEPYSKEEFESLGGDSNEK